MQETGLSAAFVSAGLTVGLVSLDVFEWFCDFFLSREMSMDRLLIWCSPTYLPENLV